MNTLKSCIKKILLLLLFLTVNIIASKAQSKIIFKVNLTPQLEDSTFIPDRDKIYVKGNIYPLTSPQKVYLKDPTPADSIYEATVSFSPTTFGDRLTYNFVITNEDREKVEQQPRFIKISSDDQELDALYFNSFAW